MTTCLEVAFANHVYEMLKHAQEKPDFEQTKKNIAKRQAGMVVKEVGSIALPTLAGYGAGKGLEKLLKGRYPAASRVKAISALPAVGVAAGAGYQLARRLGEADLGSIRKEEMGKYEQAMREYEASQKEGLS